MPKYIIDHMEPKLFKWCVLEYRHISQIVGKKNLIFTCIKSGREKLDKFGKVYACPVEKLKLKKTCILDPNSPTKLTPANAKKFDYFIFGGILGDFPPKTRTKDLIFRMPDAETRNLGKEQMSTDTAVLVAKTVADGTPLEKINFKDKIELDTCEGESVILPYRYVIKNNALVLAPGLIEMLKKQKGF